MKNIYGILLCTIFSIGIAKSQNFVKTDYPPIKKLKSISAAEISAMGIGYELVYEVVPAPDSEGPVNGFEVLKNEIEIQHPKKQISLIEDRGDADPPQYFYGFMPNPIGSGSSPLDNHLAVSNNGQIVSGINRRVTISDQNGDKIETYSLSALTDALDLTTDLFDPRIIYDPEADRLVFTCIHGRTSANSSLVVGFASSSDLTEDWHFYSLDGNPSQVLAFSDYPMLSLTKTDFFLTVNLVRENEPWETGFEESLIWQIDKQTGYDGLDLEVKLWNGILHEGIKVRNLCPIPSADENLEENMFFMSNRNFDIENDSIFLFEVTGAGNDVNTLINSHILIPENPYGAPPNAIQGSGVALQTNDARVLDGYYHNNQIQFVGNTRNIENNKAGIYHGIINDVDGGAPVIELTHMTQEFDELGYPDIAWVGLDDNDLSSIITTDAVRHPEMFPGVAAFHYDGISDYSDVFHIKEGETSFLTSGNLLRWGDYSSAQRKYNEPGVVWCIGSFSNGNGQDFSWISKIARPDLVSTDDFSEDDIKIQSFPNPSSDKITVTVDLSKASFLSVKLYSINGAYQKSFVNDKVKTPSMSSFTLDTRNIPAGMYVLSFEIDGVVRKSSKVQIN